MKQKFYTPSIKKEGTKVSVIGVDLVHLPSRTHKYGALNNKSQVFEDRRFKKPKHKKDYREDI